MLPRMRGKRSRCAGVERQFRILCFRLHEVLRQADKVRPRDSMPSRTSWYSQVTRLKRAAESRFDSIMTSIRQQSSATSVESSTASAPADLQARLEAAIGVLQDGLIERDTEVSSSKCYTKSERSMVCASSEASDRFYVCLIYISFKLDWAILNAHMLGTSLFCAYIRPGRCLDLDELIMMLFTAGAPAAAGSPCRRAHSIYWSTRNSQE